MWAVFYFVYFFIHLGFIEKLQKSQKFRECYSKSEEKQLLIQNYVCVLRPKTIQHET